MNWIYVPLADKELEDFADLLVIRDQQEVSPGERDMKYRRCDRPLPGDPSGAIPDPPLSEVADGDRVWLILHGRRSTASEVGATIDGANVFMTAAELADRMHADGLDPVRRIDIKLYVCFAGKSRIKKKWGWLPIGKEAPFAGQLYAALSKLGHQNKRIAGYRGGVQLIPYNAPHKLVSHSLHRPGLLAQLAVPESKAWSEDKETFNLKGFSRARDNKVWFDQAWLEHNRHRLPRALR
jgi:hypothetical protein